MIGNIFAASGCDANLRETRTEKKGSFGLRNRVEVVGQYLTWLAEARRSRGVLASCKFGHGLS